MPSQKYLFLHRSRPRTAAAAVARRRCRRCSPRSNAWKEKFKDNIVDMGGKLKPGGKVVTRRA